MSESGVVMPRIVGAGGGCGTSTIAAALRGKDCGVYPSALEPGARSPIVHVLVCRPTMASLGAAQAVLGRAPVPPVLAVVADLPRTAVSRSARARLRLTEPYTAEVVHVPFVASLRDVDDPLAAAAAWLDPQAPRELKEFAAAMNELVEAVVPLLAQRSAADTATAPPLSTPSPSPLEHDRTSAPGQLVAPALHFRR